jgi:tetratricopeptide (TPR) repeat protein
LSDYAEKATEWNLANSRRYREAIACFDKAIEINPNYAMAWSEKGLSLHNLGNNEEAIECFDKSLELNPNELIPF